MPDVNDTIVVTGGAGFIGSAVVRHLIRSAAARSVVNVDSLTYAGNLESLAEVADSPRYAFERVDVCDRGALDALLARRRPRAVLHLAAESHVDRSIDGAGSFVRTNVVGTFELLEAVRRYRDSLNGADAARLRLLHVSTDEVFGDLHEAAPPFDEQSAYHPSSPYAATKASSDHLVRAWHRTYDLPVLITNCSNNYGPYQFPEKLIPMMILTALEQRPLPVYGGGEQIRDWLHVEDHAEALCRVLEDGRVGATYNVGAGSERRNIDVVRSVCRTLDDLVPRKGRSSDRHEELIAHVEDRPGHDFRYAIDASRVRSELGWTPRHSFDEGLRDTVAWYLGHRTWWQRILSGAYRLDRQGSGGAA